MDESYKELEEKVWKTDRCWSCGACVIVCPAEVINFDKYAEAYYIGKIGKREAEEVIETFYTANMPVHEKECVVTERSIPCGACYSVCPQTEPMNNIAKDLFENEKIEYEDEYIGKIIGLFASTSIENIRYAQSGGAVTTILTAALEEDLIDGALIMSVDRLTMKPQAKVAVNPKEIISAAGSKYDWAPIMLAMKDAVENKKLKRLAIVGTPCVIRSARRMAASEND
ncbi:MAG: coenzyme F420 hydrogenase/dehydrogenase beta subunit N-terminal domain-containing protein, partial [Candidatus Hydrothermarchaeales archaeon]